MGDAYSKNYGGDTATIHISNEPTGTITRHKQFEYELLEYNPDVYTDVAEMLNIRGYLGWELCGVDNHQATGKLSYIFKREIIES